eukprot:1016770-Lingulodinium_polyedra.AAC.1
MRWGHCCPWIAALISRDCDARSARASENPCVAPPPPRCAMQLEVCSMLGVWACFQRVDGPRSGENVADSNA